jgi:hypothetical protein
MTMRVLRGSSEAIGSSARMNFGSWTRQALRPLAGERTDIELLERRQRDGLVLGGPQLEQGAGLADMVEPAHQDVGQHIQTADQVELLKDHGAGLTPGP